MVSSNLLLQVIALLNEAQLYDKEEKLNCLHKVRFYVCITCIHVCALKRVNLQVQELIIHKDPSLLDNFMDVRTQSLVMSYSIIACNAAVGGDCISTR